MTATDELRRMLDERGVKWCPSAWDRSTETYWKTADGNGCLAIQGETKLRLSFADYLTPEQAIEATLGPQVQPPSMPEQPPYDLLIDLLRDEWDIEVMWDGLRRFWYVGLTEEGVRKRDENEKLRELLRDMLHWMPCKRPCQRCERYRYPEGCEFEIWRRKLGVDDASVD